jgi:hypothetical protein
MNYSTAVFLMNEHVRCVLATYELDTDNPKAKRTPFKTLDTSVRVGSYVIVPTDTRHGLTVVRVVETDIDVDFDAPEQMKWIVGLVDRSPYEETLRIEEEAISAVKSAEKRKKADELRKALILDREALKTLAISTVGDPTIEDV